MEIKRDSCLEQLKIRKDNGMIKIITGIRRCGKSFLLFVLFKKYLLENGVDSEHIIEIALDGIENEELRDPKKCYQHIKDAMKDDRKYYLLLDEVQFMPRFEEVLNSLIRIRNNDVYVTGSNSKFLSSDIVTEFRGRGDEIRIYPLSFAEFYAAFDGDYDDAWEEYMMYGGLPQVAQFSVERQKAEYLKNIFTNVYIKDVVERNKIQNVDEIGTLVDILASAIGVLTNPTKISNTFKNERGINYSNKTISNHIDYLAEAFLISKAGRYDIKGRKYVGANLKYYFSDVGLRNARLNFRQQEPAHIMENIVYNELLVRGYNVDVGIVDVFAKNSEGKRVHKQLEVDFVGNQGSQRYYIQVAYDMTSEEKQTQEFNSLRNIPDSFKKIVIVNGTKKPWRNFIGLKIPHKKAKENDDFQEAACYNNTRFLRQECRRKVRSMEPFHPKWQEYEIMHGSRKVAAVRRNGMCHIYMEELLPYNLYLEQAAEEDIDGRIQNLDNFYHWCASRVLTLDREYAKEILNSIGATQAATDRERAQIALSYHCLSLMDTFWTKEKDERQSFAEINLYENHLESAFVDVFLRGRQMTIQNRHLIADDLGTQGCYPKAWVRKPDGFWLLKDGGLEPVEHELLASRIARCFRVNQVEYEASFYDGQKVSVSKIITSLQQSIVPMEYFEVYAANHEMSALEYILQLDGYSYYMMNIIDYLIGNTDRHWGNWGLLVDNKTNRPLRLYDLMDFNKAFQAYDSLEGSNCLTTVAKMTQKEAAVEAVKAVGLNQMQEVDLTWFDDAAEREMFQRRLKLLKAQENCR